MGNIDENTALHKGLLFPFSYFKVRTRSINLFFFFSRNNSSGYLWVLILADFFFLLIMNSCSTAIWMKAEMHSFYPLMLTTIFPSLCLCEICFHNRLNWTVWMSILIMAMLASVPLSLTCRSKTSMKGLYRESMNAQTVSAWFNSVVLLQAAHQTVWFDQLNIPVYWCFWY